MAVSIQQRAHRNAVVRSLEGLGWKKRQTYGDGVVNMYKVYEHETIVAHHREVMVFVDPDGTVHEPRTHETMLAKVELLNAGLLR